MNQEHSTPLTHTSWRLHGRSLLAIARKDVLHFVRYPLNAIFRIIEPIIWLTPIFFLGRSFAGSEGNSGFASYTGSADYMSFILVGTILSNYISAVFWGMGFALKNEMDSGVLESNWLTPVPRTLFLAGQTIASLTITTFNSAMMLLLGWLLFGFSIDGSLLSAALILVPMLIALYGFGFAFAAIVPLLKDANTLIDITNYLVTTLSGSQFPVQVLPRILLPLSLAIPLSYGFDAIRGILLGTTTLLPLPYEVAVLVGFMLLMVVAGFTLFRYVERRVRTLGTLGMH